MASSMLSCSMASARISPASTCRDLLQGVEYSLLQSQPTRPDVQLKYAPHNCAARWGYAQMYKAARPPVPERFKHHSTSLSKRLTSLCALTRAVHSRLEGESFGGTDIVASSALAYNSKEGAVTGFQDRSRYSGGFVEDFGSRRNWGQPCRTPESAVEETADQTQQSGGQGASFALLKEWQVTIDALAAGEQIFILRKGGIHERAFSPPSSEFLFFPSFFHATPSMLKPEFLEKHSAALEGPHERQLGDAVEVTTLARCTGLWSTKDPNILSRLQELHIWSDEFLEKRLAWKVDRPLTILELQVTPLLVPVRFEYAKEHGGCKSWVSLPAKMFSGSVTAGEPALSDADFAQAQQRLRAHLHSIELDSHPV